MSRRIRILFLLLFLSFLVIIHLLFFISNLSMFVDERSVSVISNKFVSLPFFSYSTLSFLNFSIVTKQASDINDSNHTHIISTSNVEISPLIKSKYISYEPYSDLNNCSFIHSSLKKINHFNRTKKYHDHEDDDIDNAGNDLLNNFGFSYLSDDIKSFDTDATSPTFILHIFAWRRPESLIRLCQSLLKAHYYYNDKDTNQECPDQNATSFNTGQDNLIHNIHCHFHIDGNASKEISVIINSFHWPFGMKNITQHEQHIGLMDNVMSSWIPKSANEYGIFLEDDVQVSPFFFQWILKVLTYLGLYSNSANRDHVQNFDSFFSQSMSFNLIGISLYTPRLNEFFHPKSEWHPSSLLYMYNSQDCPLFLFQAPCSWGALFFPWSWKIFHQYFVWRTTANDFNKKKERAIRGPPNFFYYHWVHSWKRYLIEWMYWTGSVMIYPNYFNETSFSTNYREPGVHTSKRTDNNQSFSYSPYCSNRPPDPLYNVPLHEKEIPWPSSDTDFCKIPLNQLPVVNLSHQPVSNEDHLFPNQKNWEFLCQSFKK